MVALLGPGSGQTDANLLSSCFHCIFRLLIRTLRKYTPPLGNDGGYSYFGMNNSQSNEYMSETDREKFVRLANARVPKAIKAIRLVGNLSNTSNYAFEPREAKKIIEALERELRGLKQRFDTHGKGDETFFKLEL